MIPLLSDRSTGILAFVGSCTLSKSFEANHRLNDRNMNEKPIHESIHLDRTYAVAIGGAWDMPFGRGKRWFARGGKAGQVSLQWLDAGPDRDVAPGISVRTVEDRFPNICNPAAPQIDLAIEETPVLRPPETNFHDDRFARLSVERNNFPWLVQAAARFIF